MLFDRGTFLSVACPWSRARVDGEHKDYLDSVYVVAIPDCMRAWWRFSSLGASSGTLAVTLLRAPCIGGLGPPSPSECAEGRGACLLLFARLSDSKGSGSDGRFVARRVDETSFVMPLRLGDLRGTSPWKGRCPGPWRGNGRGRDRGGILEDVGRSRLGSERVRRSVSHVFGGAGKD